MSLLLDAGCNPSFIVLKIYNEVRGSFRGWTNAGIRKKVLLFLPILSWSAGVPHMEITTQWIYRRGRLGHTVYFCHFKK